MKEITVTIEDGKPTITAKGFTGKACKIETAELERKLGAVETTSETAEARQLSHGKPARKTL